MYVLNVKSENKNIYFICLFIYLIVLVHEFSVNRQDNK